MVIVSTTSKIYCGCSRSCFFRELEIPLDDILLIMSQPDFNLVNALENHSAALKKRASRLERLIDTGEQTIDVIKGEVKME